MTAPTVLELEDDDPTSPAALRLAPRRGHHFGPRRSTRGRLLHSAACPCWRRPVLCGFCKRDHADAGRCRWARWLGRA